MQELAEKNHPAFSFQWFINLTGIACMLTATMFIFQQKQVGNKQIMRRDNVQSTEATVIKKKKKNPDQCIDFLSTLTFYSR